MKGRQHITLGPKDAKHVSRVDVTSLFFCQFNTESIYCSFSLLFIYMDKAYRLKELRN